MKQKTNTTVNFDRQNPSLTITRIKDNKQVNIFDISKLNFGQKLSNQLTWRHVNVNRLFCTDSEHPEAFKLTDIKNNVEVKLIETKEEIFNKKLFLLLYELKCIRQAYFNS